MRQTLVHIARLASVFAFGVCLSSAFNYLVVSNDYFSGSLYVADSQAAVPSGEEVSNRMVPVPRPVPAEELSALVPAPEPDSREITAEAKHGDTLVSFLERGGLSTAEAYEVSAALEKKLPANELKPGQQVEVQLTRSEAHPDQLALKELKLPYPEKTIQVSRTDDGKLAVDTEVKDLEKRLVRAGSSIDGSLMGSAESIGIPGGVMQSIINAYSYDVDFQRDIQPGDRFEVVYESMQDENGLNVKAGKVLYAQLVLSGDPRRIYFFTDKDGQSGFYTEDGKSVKRSLLKTPVNGARISSGFGMRRHPVLGYSKMHRGVDFAAPIGTPIYAAGDGRVERAGRWSTYGNYLRIRHNGDYSTAYAHLSRFAKGVRPGSRVKQGQVVAYVGMTGRSTGPHLHFEVLYHNAQVNPKSVKSMSSGALSRREMVRFKRQKERLRQSVASLPMQSQLASLK